MNRSLRRLCVFLAGTAVLVGPAAWGHPSHDEAPVVSLKFGGGTVAEYIDVLREAAGGVNFVFTSPEAKNFPLPPIELNSVVIETAVGLLAGEFQPDEVTSAEIYVQQIGPSSMDDRPVFRISAEWHDRLSSQVRVWNLTDLVGQGMPYDEVLSAIETAVGLLAGTVRPAQIRFHKETGLLIVRGYPVQVEAIDLVVDELTANVVLQDLAKRFQQAEALKQAGDAQLEAARAQIEDLRGALAHSTGQIQQLEMKVRELETRLREGTRR